MEGPWLTCRNQSHDAVVGLLQSLSEDSNYDKRGSWTWTVGRPLGTLRTC